MANLVVSFSINSLTLALPLLKNVFGVDQSTVSWLVVVYSLIPCCTLLILGRTAELFGYKRQFKIGFLFFGLVCLAAPLLSGNIGILIVFRCLQGLGYSIMISITQAIVSRSFGESERGKALGVNSIFVSIGLAAGPTVGGFLLTYFSWQALFYFNVPFCLLGFLAAWFILPDDTVDAAQNRRMDLTGVISLALSIGIIVIALNFISSPGFMPIPFLCCLITGAIGLIVFIWHELHAASPIMNLKLFRNRTFSLSNTICLTSYLVQQLITYLMPGYLINILLLRADTAGLMMLASPAFMLIFSPIGGSMADKKGTRLPAGLGIASIALGCLIMSFLNESSPFFIIIVVLLLVGTGNGLSVSSINASIIGSAPAESAGVASGMLATMRNLGQTLGVVFGTMILTVRQSAYHNVAENKAYLFGQRDSYYFGIAVLAVSLVLVTLLPGKRPGYMAG